VEETLAQKVKEGEIEYMEEREKARPMLEYNHFDGYSVWYQPPQVVEQRFVGYYFSCYLLIAPIFSFLPLTPKRLAQSYQRTGVDCQPQTLFRSSVGRGYDSWSTLPKRER